MAMTIISNMMWSPSVNTRSCAARCERHLPEDEHEDDNDDNECKDAATDKYCKPLPLRRKEARPRAGASRYEFSSYAVKFIIDLQLRTRTKYFLLLLPLTIRTNFSPNSLAASNYVSLLTDVWGFSR